MKILDMGCGRNKLKNSIGVDVNIDSNADLVCDLNSHPYPLKDNVFDIVVCFDILEHLSDIIKTMEEIHRVAKPNAEVRIRVPFISSVNLFSDPTHKRAFTSRSFDFFVDNTKVSQHRYSNVRFSVIKVEYNSGGRRKFWFDRILQALANKYKEIYEKRFAYLYPINEISFVLRVEK